MAGICGLSNWVGVVLDSRDPLKLAEFYRDLLGWPIASTDPTWVTMTWPGVQGNLAFALDEHYEPPVWPSQAGVQTMQSHLDIGVTSLEPAVSDALALGARLADFQPQDDVRVLLDPAGHPFCLYLDDGD